MKKNNFLRKKFWPFISVFQTTSNKGKNKNKNAFLMNAEADLAIFCQLT
jgi:hypothetical protein